MWIAPGAFRRWDLGGCGPFADDGFLLSGSWWSGASPQRALPPRRRVAAPAGAQCWPAQAVMAAPPAPGWPSRGVGGWYHGCQPPAPLPRRSAEDHKRQNTAARRELGTAAESGQLRITAAQSAVS
jgi:hypothetical protein